MITEAADRQIIDFRTNSKKLFTNVFYKIRNVKSRVIVLRGGAGSSKSYSVAQSEIINILKEEKGDTLILRKYGADLRESVYKLFCDIIIKYGLATFFKFTYSNDNRRITYLPSGRSFIFKGVDDSEKLKSIVGIKRIIMEEATQFAFSDFLEINRRARGMDEIQFILILNPVSEKHWIKTNLCNENSSYKDSVTEIVTTYHDNQFLTKTDIQELERLKYINENQYRIYVLAEWGIEDKSNKFAFAFEASKHVGSVEYNPDYLIWLSFDFNVNPISCTAFQYYDDVLRAIKCFKLENSNIYELCKVIGAYFPEAMFKVTGDASGTSRSAMVADNVNYYTIIKDELGLIWSQFNIPSVNPRIEENQVKVNAVLYAGLFIADSENCKELIYDLTYVEIDENKKIIKDRTAESKKSDFLDHFRYICNIIWPNMKSIKPV